MAQLPILMLVKFDKKHLLYYSKNNYRKTIKYFCFLLRISKYNYFCAVIIYRLTIKTYYYEQKT